MQNKYIRAMGAFFLGIVAIILYGRATERLDDGDVTMLFAVIIIIVLTVLWVNHREKEKRLS